MIHRRKRAKGHNSFCVIQSTVFTDIEMPGAFDGLSLAHKVFQRRPEVLLILTSAHEPLRDEMPPRAHFLVKPYDCNLLTELITAA